MRNRGLVSGLLLCPENASWYTLGVKVKARIHACPIFPRAREQNCMPFCQLSTGEIGLRVSGCTCLVFEFITKKSTRPMSKTEPSVF